MKTKILHVITGLNVGGAESVLSRICFTRSNCEHVVVSLSRGGFFEGKLVEKGIPVHGLAVKKNVISVCLGFVRLRRIIKTESPDVIQSWMYHSDFFAFVANAGFSKIPLVWSIRNTTLDPMGSGRMTVTLVKVLGFFAQFSVLKTITTCAQTAIDVHAKHGYPREKFTVIPNGVDCERFQPLAEMQLRLRDYYRFPVQGCDAEELPFQIGFVGRFHAQKNIPLLLQAVSDVLVERPNCYLACAGSGIDSANLELRSLIQENNLGSHISLRGFLSDVDLFFNALDILILPSSFGEAFPNVLAEAMACGIPCIATDVGDSRIIIGDTGWIVQPNSRMALADAIISASDEFADKDKWRKRKEKCRFRVESKYSLEMMIERYTHLWQEELLHDV